MASKTVENLRSSLLTSIFGRRLGLTPNEFLAGSKDVQVQVLELTTASTATAIPNFGLVTITASSLGTSAAGGTFLLSNPEQGVSVTIQNINADSSAASPGCTAMTFIRPSTAFVIKSSEGSTMTTVNLAAGCAVTLTGLTTGVIGVTNRVTLAGVIVNGTT